MALVDLLQYPGVQVELQGEELRFRKESESSRTYLLFLKIAYQCPRARESGPMSWITNL